MLQLATPTTSRTID